MAAVNLVSLEVLNHSGKSFRIEFHKKLTQIIQAEHAVISDRSIAEIPMRQLINVAFGHQDNSSVRETALTIDDGGQRVILKRADNRFLINDVVTFSAMDFWRCTGSWKFSVISASLAA